jgi:hypothetical protein
MRRWRRICRRVIADDVPPGSLREARTARIELLRHQLEPALSILSGAGSRVLLADVVGLAKTIQLVCSTGAPSATTVPARPPKLNVPPRST